MIKTLMTARHLALAVTLTALSAMPLRAHSLQAQITNPSTLVAPAPQQPTHRDQLGHTALRSADLQWLWQYAQPAPAGNKAALLADPRFTALLRDQLKTRQAFWGDGRPLSAAATDFLAGEGSVTAADNRYFIVTGCVKDQCGQKGLLWIDLGASAPLTVFVARRWDEAGKTPDQQNATFAYWLFPSRDLDPQHEPQALRSALAQWADIKDCVAPDSAVLVDILGTPHLGNATQFGIGSKICTHK